MSGFSRVRSYADSGDFRLLLDGKIDAKEYVRRLDARIAERRCENEGGKRCKKAKGDSGG